MLDQYDTPVPDDLVVLEDIGGFLDLEVNEIDDLDWYLPVLNKRVKPVILVSAAALSRILPGHEFPRPEDCGLVFDSVVFVPAPLHYYNSEDGFFVPWTWTPY